MTRIFAVLIGTLFFVQVSATASEAIKGAQKDLEKFKTEMSVKLDNVEKKLVEMKTKVKNSGNAAQEETINELEKTRAQLKTDLSTLQENGKTDWKKIKSSFAESLDNLNSKIQKAIKN